MSKPGFTMRVKKDLDPRAFDEIRARISREKPFVNVGFPAGGGEEANGASVAEVAAVHEFGAPEKGIPERSFMRTGIRGARADFIALNSVSLKKVVRGEMTLDAALGLLGTMGQAKVQAKIRSGEFAPLKPATIRRKGSSKPLIDSGQMLQSVTWVMGDKASD